LGHKSIVLIDHHETPVVFEADVVHRSTADGNTTTTFDRVDIQSTNVHDGSSG
jgi:hypothetical protein